MDSLSSLTCFHCQHNLLSPRVSIQTRYAFCLHCLDQSPLPSNFAGNPIQSRVSHTALSNSTEQIQYVSLRSIRDFSRLAASVILPAFLVVYTVKIILLKY